MVDLQEIKMIIDGQRQAFANNDYVIAREANSLLALFAPEMLKEIELLHSLLAEKWDEHEFDIADDYEALTLADQGIDYHSYYNKHTPKVSPLVESVIKKLLNIKE